MHKRLAAAVVALAVASLAVPASASAAADVTNGSFELGPTVQPFETLAVGSAVLDPWTIDAGTVDAIGSYWQPSNGERSLDLNGTDAGTISQPISTTVGARYDVTFDLSGNPAGGPAVKTLTVSATDAVPEPKSFDTVAAENTLLDMKWTPEHYAFVATTTETVLTFESTTSGFFGPALDNVTVTETTPADKAGCKDGGWIALTDSAAGIFKNQGDCVSFVATGGKNVAAGTTTIPAAVAAHTKSAERHATAVVTKKVHTETTHAPKSKHQKSHSPSGKK